MEITDSELKAIINEAAKKAAQAACAQIKKQDIEKPDRYNDTFSVMKNYRDAKLCVANTTDIATKLNTSLKLHHIDTALEEMKKRREAQGRSVEYEAFKLYFIDGIDYETISEKLETSKNTPRRWVTSILSELSVMFWGIDNEL